jgi:hypothetical protein
MRCPNPLEWTVAGFWRKLQPAIFSSAVAVTAAGVPEMRGRMGTPDYIDAIVSSFSIVLLFTLWVGSESNLHLYAARRPYRSVRHTSFGTMWLATTGRWRSLLYVAAHFLGVGGISGGLVAEKRKTRSQTGGH